MLTEEAWLRFRFLLVATMPSGVKGLMFAILGFSEVDVESHSWRLVRDSGIGREDRRAPSSSNSSRDFRLKSLGADLGELMAHALLGEPRPSNSLMARIVWEGGDGELKGLWPSEKRFLGSLGHWKQANINQFNIQFNYSIWI